MWSWRAQIQTVLILREMTLTWCLAYFFPLSIPPASFFFFGHHATWHVGSSLTRDQICAPALGIQSLNHWTTREVPSPASFVGKNSSDFWSWDHRLPEISTQSRTLAISVLSLGLCVGLGFPGQGRSAQLLICSELPPKFTSSPSAPLPW